MSDNAFFAGDDLPYDNERHISGASSKKIDESAQTPIPDSVTITKDVLGDLFYTSLLPMVRGETEDKYAENDLESLYSDAFAFCKLLGHPDWTDAIVNDFRANKERCKRFGYIQGFYRLGRAYCCKFEGFDEPECDQDSPSDEPGIGRTGGAQ